jgi:hypothetical protein
MKTGFYIKRIWNTLNIHKRLSDNSKILYELDWANVFNSTIADSTWLTDRSFSPGRYAIGYSFLYVLYRILDGIKPVRILEFGLGQSSKMLCRYASGFDHTNVTTIEHNTEWINFFRQSVSMPANARIIEVEAVSIMYKGHQSVSVKGHEEEVKGKKYDLILLDAPSRSKRYSRPQILNLIPENIDPSHFCIIIDDYHRYGEQETCSELEKLFRSNNIEFHKNIYCSIKDFALYCSPDLKFLTSL